MEKIIATTDFSANSKAGLRYAIRLAKLRKAEVVFVHIHHVLKASFWSGEEYNHFINKSRQVITKESQAFIKSIYRSMSMQVPDNPTIIVHHNLDTVAGILESAQKIKASYICIATRGASGLRKIFGTTTSKLSRLSSVPVLCIPSSYRMKPINRILYASDMDDYQTELLKVVGFAKPLQAAIDMLHFSYPFEHVHDADAIEQGLKKKVSYHNINLHYQSRNIERPIMDDIVDAIHKVKPSLLALFTHQDLNLLDWILLPGNAKYFSFRPSVPLIIFPKAHATNTEGNHLEKPNRKG